MKRHQKQKSFINSKNLDLLPEKMTDIWQSSPLVVAIDLG